MTGAFSGMGRLLRQAMAIARPAGRVVTWTPLAATSVAGIALLALGSRTSVPIHLSLVGMGLAAASAFMIDDPAAVTLAASPTAIRARRLLRLAAVTVGAGTGWAGAAVLATHRLGNLPMRGPTLEFVTLVAVAVAVSGFASTVGDRTAGGIAGAVVTIACFATTFLPPRSWLPFPPDPAAPGGASRLLGVLVLAATVTFVETRDPARRRRDRVPSSRFDRADSNG